MNLRKYQFADFIDLPLLNALFTESLLYRVETTADFRGYLFRSQATLIEIGHLTLILWRICAAPTFDSEVP